MSDGFDLGEEFDFDVQSMEIEERNYDPIPADEYLMQCDKAEPVGERDEDGKWTKLMVKLTFRILDGDHENRLIWMNACLKGYQEIAIAIGNELLGKLCKSVGAPSFQFTSLYTDKPFIGKVGFEKQKDPKYPAKNIIKEFYPLDHAQAPEPPKQVGPRPAARPAPASGQSNAASAGKSRPWDKKAS